MINKVHLTPYFYRKAKRLLKKYASLNKNLKQLQVDLIDNPQLGVSYGSNIYKIRISDEAKGKGKSGGFRVITYLINKTENSTDIFLIIIFDKSEESSMSKDDIKKIIQSENL